MLLKINLKKKGLTMRTYDEMTENVFGRIHEYNKKKLKSRRIFRRISVFCGICIIVIGGLYIYNTNIIEKTNDLNVITGGADEGGIDLVINGKSYIIIESDVNNYTKDKFIGFASDFEIIENTSIRKDEKLFAVKENDYTILLISSNEETRLLIDLNHAN